MRLKNIGSNQTELTFDSGVIAFISYETCVACFEPGKGVFKTLEKHSKTTSKHINTWLRQFSANVTITEKPQTYFDFLLSNPETTNN
jgi:hypothetical protein